MPTSSCPGSPPELSAFLREPAFWPGKAESVQVIETHISLVFLAGPFAWKVKKPVRFDFLDFSSLERRKECCEREVALNRRTAPDLYLAVVPITGAPEAPILGGDGEPLEFVIKMRRFRQEDLLLNRVRAGMLGPGDIDRVADVVAGFHRAARPAPKDVPWGTYPAIVAASEGNIASLLEDGLSAADRGRVEAVAAWARAEQHRLVGWFEQRRAEGFVRECHGDLHLRNIVIFRERPCLFDGIEFNESFRWIDILNDLAFLVTDLHGHGLSAFGARLLNRWLEGTGDYPGVQGLRYYLVYRALVRAKVDSIQLHGPHGPHGPRGNAKAGGAREELTRELRGYLAFAGDVSAPDPPVLIIMHGFSGSGKTTVSGQLLESLGAIRIRSDVERKRLAGLLEAGADAASISAPPGMYHAEQTRRTYRRLAVLAGTVLKAGFPVVVDAAFLRREWRDIFRDLARGHGVPFHIVSCEAPRAELRDRLLRRSQAGADASDAGAEVLELQWRSAESLARWEREQAFVPAGDDPLRSAARWAAGIRR